MVLQNCKLYEYKNINQIFAIEEQKNIKESIVNLLNNQIPPFYNNQFGKCPILMQQQVNKSKSMSSNSLEQQMLPKQQLGSQRPYFQTLKQKLFGSIQSCNRVVFSNGTVIPENFHSNLVKNTKYNLFTFVPQVLYNQFKFFINMFFLVTALSQLIPVLRVGLFVTFIGPLVLVLGLTMGKQAYDDLRTHQRDIQANSKKYQVIQANDIKKVKSKDLKIGDIVKIQAGDRIPADMVILHTSDEQGTLFLKTDQLDGQTDWKLRKAMKHTQNIVGKTNEYHKLREVNFKVSTKAPISNIYKFDGLFQSQEIKEKLSLQNTMWTSTVLTNGNAIGFILYIGKQTRVALGASTPRTKFGIVDMEINLLSKILFSILFILTLILVLLQGMQIKYFPIQFMRILILLSSVIPISMRVNLDFAKLFYAFTINKDDSIPGTMARNSNTPEQLGRVKYILTDKTGTLTQNEMIFKRISIQDNIKYTDDQVEEIKQIMKDYDQIHEHSISKQKYLKDILTALILCHNVTPVFSQDGIEKSFQASSPDQITFVKTAQSFGLTLQERTQSKIRIKTPSGKMMNFQILYTFPFSSDTKRMGIILKQEQTGKIEFYLKGADAVMKQFIQNKQKKGFIDQQCKDLSMTGLRTLVISKRCLSEQEYWKWSNMYETANQKLQINQQEIYRIMLQIENGVQFLGVTGIEDKLQRNLKQTIESLKAANIRIWMITGDKVETAECISISCGLQKVTQENVKIQEADKPVVWKNKWENVKLNKSRVLIVDGKTLTMVLNNKQYRKDFFLNAMKMPAVICCRCSPQQKRLITQGVKQFRKDKEAVLGIGDGGNDVGMIQAADVGVGLQGKQGKQAALAADFSIQQFKSIKTLLLWHGRLSYKRSALLANFIIHRGLIVSVIQVIFTALFFYVSIPVFNSQLMLGYATIFTFWPVFSLILDKDINKKVALQYPKLYSSLQEEQLLQWSEFLIWLWKALFQGSIIMILGIFLFTQNSYLLIETVCFTSLIVTEYLMTLFQIHRIHGLTIACVGASLLCYAFVIVFFTDYIHVSTFTVMDCFYIAAIVLFSFGPLLIAKLLRKILAPTDYEKCMKHAKRRPLGFRVIGDNQDRLYRTSAIQEEYQQELK